MTITLDDLRKMSDAATPGLYLYSKKTFALRASKDGRSKVLFAADDGNNMPVEQDEANGAFIAALVNWFRPSPDPIAAAYLAGQQAERERATPSAPQYVTCPFCHDVDFDLIGLKHHFQMGYCEVFNDTDAIHAPDHDEAGDVPRAMAMEDGTRA